MKFIQTRTANGIKFVRQSLQQLLGEKYLIAISLGYFLFRFLHLTAIPIFNDEAIYLDWGWRELHLGDAFYSLYDAKPPLLLWLFGASEKIFSSPLVAGRSVSVIAGFLTLLGLYFLGRDFFSKKIGLIASFLYICVPLFSFFDRQALMESAIAATIVWSIYFFLKITKKHSLIFAVALGMTIGCSFLIKGTIVLLIPALVIAALWHLAHSQKGTDKFLFVRDIGVSILVSQIVAWPLYVQPSFWQTFGKNTQYSLTLNEVLHFPFGLWLTHLWISVQISFWHVTPLIFFAAIVGFVLLLRKGTRAQKIIFFIFIIECITFILFARNVGVRYIMPLLPVVLLAVATLVDHFSKKEKFIFPLLILLPLYFTMLQIFQPLTYFHQLQFLTPYSQKTEYVTDWTAGYAVTQAIHYLQTKKLSDAYIAVRIDAGNPENAIFTFFENSPTIKPKYFEASVIPNNKVVSCLKSPVPFYFVSRDDQLAGLGKYLQADARFYNPGRQTSVGVYTLQSSCQGATFQLQ